ncbi:MAG TPA: nucleotide exchange factor GrpE [Chthoniobacterales bacterium]|nr:nucleotide exchange factor GrpE [Chthoniobacterales bacterium]
MKKTSHSSHSHDKSQDVQEEHQEIASKTTTPSESQDATLPQETVDPCIELKAEVEKYRDQALRAVADLENYRKRMIREKEESLRYANSSLLEKLLPILDNFELGLAAAKTNADAGAMSILNGLSMVQRQLNDFLKEQGLHAIDAEGQPFDPKFHEALGQEASDTIAEGTVISQLRRGYRLADRLIRPASVMVSKGRCSSNVSS